MDEQQCVADQTGRVVKFSLTNAPDGFQPQVIHGVGTRGKGMKKHSIFAIIVAALMGFPSTVLGGFAVDLEGGGVFPSYNNVRIPGDTGTKISLTDDLDSHPAAYIRGRITYAFSERHSMAVTVAPLRLEADGSVEEDVTFDDATFPAGTELNAEYRFDSYRLTYRYDFHRTSQLKAGLGLTAFVRDAQIRLKGGGQSASKTNVGFAPLINFNVEWMPVGRFIVVMNGDVLASSQGRAEDVLLALRYRASDSLGLHIGYRIIEGGSDNDEVYTFSLLNLLALGATWAF